jgi:hypothetical protein
LNAEPPNIAREMEKGMNNGMRNPVHLSKLDIPKPGGTGDCALK